MSSRLTEIPSEISETGIDPAPIIRRLLLCLGLVIIALIMPIPFQQRAASAAGDLVHAPLFAVLGWALLRTWRRARPIVSMTRTHVTRSVIVVAILITFGIAMEVVQGFLGRSAAIHDAVANGVGSIAGALWYLSGVRLKDAESDSHRSLIGQSTSTQQLLKSSLRLIAVAMIAAAWWNPIQVLADVARVRLEFPMVSSFERNIELARWHLGKCRGKLVREGVTDGSYAMEFTFDDSKHPAVTLLDVQPDWTSCRALEVDVTPVGNETDPSIEFVLKVIDHDHADYFSDVFRKTVFLRPGVPVRISVTREEIIQGPKKRDLDLANIKHVSLQVLKPGREVKLLFDRLVVRQ